MQCSRTGPGTRLLLGLLMVQAYLLKADAIAQLKQLRPSLPRPGAVGGAMTHKQKGQAAQAVLDQGFKAAKDFGRSLAAAYVI